MAQDAIARLWRQVPYVMTQLNINTAPLIASRHSASAGYWLAFGKPWLN